MKKNKTTLIMVLFFFIGLAILLYPSISNFYNQKVQSKAIIDYESILNNIKKEDYTDYFNKADKYNKKLLSMKRPLLTYKNIKNYNKILNLNDHGMMGYLTIDKIKVELPIYHGTSADVLNKAVGHLEGTSLPVGGKGTHSVLSAHRGLPSFKLFTDLDKLEIGDTFVINILDRTITYQVDKILTRNNWNILWSNKIDYFEYQINQMGKKYPILVDTFAYFTGLAENAISYVKYTTLETQIETSDNPVISHRKINNTTQSLYNPLNIILDHKSRDIAEYIKLSFLNKNTNIYQELDSYFSNNYYSEYGLRLLYARIIYPSFYFDMYEQIIQGLRKESDLLNIVTLLDDYELYLKEMYYYLKKYHNIPEIDWITKK